ncbi:MOP flippase family protein [Vibrio splendidus]
MNSLVGRVLTGFKWTSASKLSFSLVQLCQLVILSRLLNPSDFGLVSMAMIIIGFSHIFADFGVSNGIIQREEVNDTDLSTLYWFNIATGIIITSIVFTLSGLIAHIFDEPRLALYVKVLSFVFLINSFYLLYLSILKKKLNFQVIAKMEVLSRLISFLIVVIIAYFNPSPMAIVAGTLSYSFVFCLVILIFGRQGFRPKIEFNLESVKDVISFGFYNMGQNTIVYLNNQLDIILIGRVLGAEVLGVYSLIKQVVMKPAQIFNPIVTSVMFPVMSTIRSDKELLKKYYLQTLAFTSSINFIVYLLFIAFSKDIIDVVLGDKWSNSNELFSILCLYALFRSTTNPAGSLILACGKAKWGMYWSFFEVTLMPLSIYLGSKFGVNGIAWGLVVFQLVTLLPTWYFLVSKLCDCSLYDYFIVQIKPLCSSILVVGSIYLLLNSEWLSQANSGKYFFIIPFTCVTAYISTRFINNDVYEGVCAALKRGKS